MMRQSNSETAPHRIQKTLQLETLLPPPSCVAPGTFIQTGWDLVDETGDHAGDIWRILEGKDYPQPWWKLSSEN